ncbi:hypothetical protein [Streptomyces sp. XD-27]|uniref:hypothetical protein n=1 Tax=Streptomyces sp. XD-27 TaxID=3062779 RepID=UPI0026F46567|nr:hypothetical protein [Streptomyces sp. XD-27]WKX70549.1 hypothetical protein Q3Y56_12020 [Streptomyces sp. XD-27]
MTPPRGSIKRPSRAVTLLLALIAGFVAGLAADPTPAAAGHRYAAFATAHIATPVGAGADAAGATADVAGDRAASAELRTAMAEARRSDVTAASRQPAQCDRFPHPARDGTQAAVTGTPHTDPLPHPAATHVAVPAGRTPHAVPPRAPPLPPTGCAELLPVLRI